MRKVILAGFLCFLSLNFSFAKNQSDTLSVYFDFNKYQLKESEKNRIDQAIYEGTLSDFKGVQIIGHTDEIGSEDYNISLSKRRAETVKEYLIASGFRAQSIQLILAKGEMDAQPAISREGTPRDRRVDIISNPASKIKKETPISKASEAVPTPGPVKKSLENIGSLKPGDTLVLENIYFFPGRHIVRPESDQTLNKLYLALEAHPKIRVSIEGHVCCVSSKVIDALDEDTRRLELSVNRARAIREYLIKRGLDADRFEYRGFGHSRPVVWPERTEEDANKNRRVEIRIIK